MEKVGKLTVISFILIFLFGCDINDLFEQSLDHSYQRELGRIDTMWVEQECSTDTLVWVKVFSLGEGRDEEGVQLNQRYDRSVGEMRYTHFISDPRSPLPGDSLYIYRWDFYIQAPGEGEPVGQILNSINLYPDSLTKGIYWIEDTGGYGFYPITIGCE